MKVVIYKIIYIIAAVVIGIQMSESLNYYATKIYMDIVRQVFEPDLTERFKVLEKHGFPFRHLCVFFWIPYTPLSILAYLYIFKKQSKEPDF